MTSAPEAIKLLPCPFCNGAMKFYQSGNLITGEALGWLAHTEKKDCPIAKTGDIGGEKTWLIEKWNTRPEPPHEDASHVEIEMLREALECALHNMSRDQQATMTNPTYEEATALLATEPKRKS